MSVKPCILCLDDDAEILKSLKLLFENDYEVLTTTSPFQALGLLKTHKVNLIISDHRMPEMNGLEFFQKIKEEHGDKQYYKIIYSGYSEMEKDMIKMIASKVINEFLTKSCPTKLLYKTIASGVEKSKTMVNL
ncbi:response regulator [bacterium]|nr:response regulator [bacterium]NUN45127.1 response regulator [bacterium]